MGKTRQALLDHGVVALVGHSVRDASDWAAVAANGGIRIFGVPVERLTVATIVDELKDEAGVSVGVTGVHRLEHITIALAAGADFVHCANPTPRLVETARDRGLEVIAGAMTPSEVGGAIDTGAEVVSVEPVDALGPRYFASVARQYPGAKLVAGGVDVELAPRLLELGALACVVDRGIFPEPGERAALEVIIARARALVEVCADTVMARRRHRPATIPPPVPRVPARPKSDPPPIPGSHRLRPPLPIRPAARIAGWLG